MGGPIRWRGSVSSAAADPSPGTGLRGSVRRDRQLRVECAGSPEEFRLWFDDLAAGFHEVGVQCCALSGRVGHAVRAWLERDWPFHSIEYAPRV